MEELKQRESGWEECGCGHLAQNTRPQLLFAWRSSIIETQSINQGRHYSSHLVIMDEAMGWCVCCHASGQTPEYICMCSMQIAMTPWQALIAF